MLSSGPSETLLENRHFLRSNSIRSLQIENEKGPDRHPIFVNQMYNLVKPLAHPAGFEPTACRLGVFVGRVPWRSSEIVKALWCKDGGRFTVRLSLHFPI